VVLADCDYSLLIFVKDFIVTFEFAKI